MKMPPRAQRIQQQAARAASQLAYKKRNSTLTPNQGLLLLSFGANYLTNQSTQPLPTTESGSETLFFLNESANANNSDSEEGRQSDVDTEEKIAVERGITSGVVPTQLR